MSKMGEERDGKRKYRHELKKKKCRIDGRNNRVRLGRGSDTRVALSTDRPIR